LREVVGVELGLQVVAQAALELERHRASLAVEQGLLPRARSGPRLIEQRLLPLVVVKWARIRCLVWLPFGHGNPSLK
jgi:hypothetical protein